MGEVLLGIDPSIGREVAIKTILPTVQAGGDAKERFAREAKAAGVLNHPNLVTIYEFGEDQGVLYIAMELVKGHDFEELLREQSLTRSEALEILAQVCDGLQYAHTNHIVHRDIKPSNVRVQRDGKRLHAKVMDFGVARVGNSDMTATGMVMGTVSYMAPEYIRTGRPDPRSDLFAVGVMLYEALSGRKPFSGDTTPTILYKIVNEPPEPLDTAGLVDISPSIRQVLDNALCKDPDQRYQSAEDLARALRSAKDPTWTGLVGAPATTAIPAGAHGTRPAAPAVPATAPALVAPAPPARPQPAKSGSGAGLFLGLAAAAMLLIGGGGLGLWLMRDKLPFFNSDVAPAAGAAPAETPAAPTEPAPSPTAPAEPPATGAAPATHLPAAPSGARAVEPRPAETRSTTRSSQEPAATHGAETAPAPTPSNDPFAQENLRKLSAPERLALSNQTMSEATSLADSNPTRAIEMLRRAIAANPDNERAYAWLLVALYRQERFAEFQSTADMARRNGISFQRMMSNARFRSVIQDERLNRRLPGGLRGVNED
ncbi:MAG: protein kinase [Holophagaceae bacterium]|nr:protein kinase [Holophagaceae bacterium]